jgi:hypothetical protein
VTYAGSFITQHPQLRAQQAAAEALAMAGTAAILAKGSVAFPGGGDAVPVAEVMKTLGVSTIENMLTILKIGKDALVWVTMNPEGRILSYTFTVSFSGMTYLDNYLHVSNWVADAAFTYDWRYWAVAAMLSAPPPGKPAGQGTESPAGPDVKGSPDPRIGTLLSRCRVEIRMDSWTGLGRNGSRGHLVHRANLSNGMFR